MSLNHFEPLFSEAPLNAPAFDEGGERSGIFGFLKSFAEEIFRAPSREESYRAEFFSGRSVWRSAMGLVADAVDMGRTIVSVAHEGIRPQARKEDFSHNRLALAIPLKDYVACDRTDRNELLVKDIIPPGTTAVFETSPYADFRLDRLEVLCSPFFPNDLQIVDIRIGGNSQLLNSHPLNVGFFCAGNTKKLRFDKCGNSRAIRILITNCSDREVKVLVNASGDVF